MRGDPESPSGTRYRAARRAFIAACEKAHVETVARLHPAKAPDGKPLFMDCAAKGPRHAPLAVLALAHDAPGGDMLMALLDQPEPPPDARLVLVHAFDPARFAGVAGDAGAPLTMLQAVATEDLSRVKQLGVLSLLSNDPARDRAVMAVLKSALPGARITLLPSAASARKAQQTAASFFGAH
ncbi:MAG TPA: hypothetical protein VFI23_04750 [Rhizomicrobium sp.]|nr:hypothetical protein [Rhizomicrobium sp.]